MNRAMFSGVAGMKTHQTKLDVIGNNIANVNTYGYKSQRAIFSDVFYQTLNGASQGTASRGGTNPSTVGYGSSLASIQTQMSQSSMQNTGFGLDVAITGEGFLQVMDADGNIFYTKAGLLDYDANGYLVDVNGNFVLGASDVNGKPNTQKIKLDGVGAVSPVAPKASQEINGITYTLTGSNATKDGNVGISLTSGQLPIGEKAKAVISNSGSITVQLNATEVFSSLTELNNEINKAIVLANNNQPHAAGTFTLTMTDAAGNDASYKFSSTIPASITGGPGATGASFLGGATITELSPDFAGTGALDFSGSSFDATGDMILRAEAANGRVYSVTIPRSSFGSPQNVTLNGVGGAAGSITMSIPSISTMVANTVGASVTETDLAAAFSTYLANHNYAGNGTGGITGGPGSTGASFLGGATITPGSGFNGSGDLTFTGSFTAGNNMAITATDEDGRTYTVTIPYSTLSTSGPHNVTLAASGGGANGTIEMTIPDIATMVANTVGASVTEADLEANFFHYLTNHSYSVTAPQTTSTGLTGEQIAVDNYDVIAGKVTGFPVANFKFEGTSNDFRGDGAITNFGLTYSTAGGVNSWTVAMTIDGVVYSGTIPETAVGSSLLLKGPGGDSIQLGIPSFSYINSLFGSTPNDGETLDLMDGTKVDPPFGTGNTATPSIPSSNLGLSSVGFNLAGGTVGGPVTLDQLSSIAIGNDGTISVSHPDKGTINVGKVSLANFANPRGLLQEGTNYYSETVNSGKAVLCDPGTNGTGGLKSNSLEMSNVDLSQEFADMITTQRGFQANTRVITVSDTMLEELINLKR